MSPTRTVQLESHVKPCYWHVARDYGLGCVLSKSHAVCSQVVRLAQ